MVTCIVLAAGESKRFGSPKPLADLNGTPAISVICTTLLNSRVDRILVVLGHEADRVHTALPAHERIHSVTNKEYTRGMTSSFQAALTTRAGKDTDLMLLPVDMPFVKTATIDLVCRTFKEQGPMILVPTYNDRSGHPPVFAASLTDNFALLRDKEPLSSVQHRFKDRIVRLPVDDPGVIRTYSTPAELRRLLQT